MTTRVEIAGPEIEQTIILGMGRTAEFQLQGAKFAVQDQVVKTVVTLPDNVDPDFLAYYVANANNYALKQVAFGEERPPQILLSSNGLRATIYLHSPTRNKNFSVNVTKTD